MANFPLPSDPVQKEKIMKVIREVSNSKTRVEAEREFIKEEMDALSKGTQIPKKHLNKFANDYHKSKFAETVGVSEDYQELVLALQPKAIVPDLRQEGDDE